MTIHPTHAIGRKVLITGASGFLGRRVVALLSNQGYSIRAFVRKTSRIEHLVARSVDIAVGDVADASSLESAFDGISYVVHAAADTTGSKEDGRSSTINGTRNIISLCSQFDIKKLVYVSSCSVYQVAGLGAHEVIEEGSSLESSPSLRGPYSWAKLEAERLVTAFISEGTTPVVCLRPGAIYGPEGNPFPPMAGYSLKNKFFFVIGLGNLRLPLVHVDNLAEAILRSLEGKNADGKIFNVVDPDRVTKRRYNNLLVRRLYPKARFIYVPYSLVFAGVSVQELLFALLRRSPILTRYRLASSQKSVVFDGAKIMRELDWEPSTTFEQAIEEFREL